MYDPITGRYTQPDPLRFVDGLSVYAYAKNMLLMLTDSSGLVAVFKSYPHSPIPAKPSSVQQCGWSSNRKNCHEFCWAKAQVLRSFDKHGWYLKCMNNCMADAGENWP